MDRFAICQAFLQLEVDFNIGGVLWERPSNLRRRESIAVQLHRMKFWSTAWWVDITGPCDEGDPDDGVRDVYMRHVLKWGLPIDADLERKMLQFYTPEFLRQYPAFQGERHEQEH